MGAKRQAPTGRQGMKGRWCWAATARWCWSARPIRRWCYALPNATVAAEPPSPPSKSDVASQDDGNLKETVLALNKRLWEAHTKQDVNTFKNLLADDFMGLDIYRRPYRKTGALEHVSKYRVEDAAMSNVKVILLNTTSAIVTSESRFKVLLADGK